MKKDETVKNLQVIKTFDDACNLLASRVNGQLFDNCRSWYWAGDEIGGVCDFEDEDFLSTTDMKLIVANGMSYDDYSEWREANSDNEEIGYINLKSWIRGARHSMMQPKLRCGVWTSVKNELPPYDEAVLCCNIAEPDDMFFCHRSDNPNVQTDSNGWCHYAEGNITHWMRIKALGNYDGRDI